MADALLNPTEDAAASKAMVLAVTTRQQRLGEELVSVVLDRETYLLKVGAYGELKRLAADLQREYDRRFKV